MTTLLEDQPPLSDRAKRIALIGIVVAPALLVFLAAEILVRVKSPHDDLWALTGRARSQEGMADWAYLDAFAGYKGKPGTYHYGRVVKTVDRAGFISTPEIAPRKPANTIRIVFLGESSTAGTGTLLPDSVTWPWQVAENLRHRPHRTALIEFINAALGGYSTFESYGRLWSRIRFYAPDIVVVYHGWNEMYYFPKVDQITEWRTLPDGSWGFESAEPVTVYAPRWYDWLVRPSQLLTKVRLRLSTPLTGEVKAGQFARELATDFDPRGLEIFRSNLRLIRATTEQLGAQLLVGKQATLMVPGLPERERKRCRYDLHRMDYDAHLRAFQAIYHVIDQEIPRDGIVDVTPLSGVPENFYDHIHPTPLGARRTAAIMADAIEPWVESIEARRAARPAGR
jgi:lysophospholipase L1-like esterase